MEVLNKLKLKEKLKNLKKCGGINKGKIEKGHIQETEIE